MSKHQKHTKLMKPDGGLFHRIEIGFVGAPCSTLQTACQQLSASLSSNIKVGYADADHGEGEKSSDYYHAIYTDKISFHRNDNSTVGYLAHRKNFAACDVVFVNGNHFASKRNIVFVHEKKYDSLARKIHRIKQIDAIVLCEGVSEPFDFLAENYDLSSTPIVALNDLISLSSVIASMMTENCPPLHGLVLMGGKSVRMGERKSHLVYHDKAQYRIMADMLNDVCVETSLSLQTAEENLGDYPQIVDTFIGLGPFGGIISAFRQNPNVAYLTVPCDVPLLTREAINYLIDHRDQSKVATCFYNPATEFPEPLITIWEPRAYSIMLEYLAMGYSCPRKVLINEDIQMIKLLDEAHIQNVNTPEEKAAVLRKIQR